MDEHSEMEGKWACAGTVMLDATYRGEIIAQDTLILGERSVVHATIQAATLIVRGELVGDVTASERVELARSARVTGDISAPSITMEQGAVHDGNCRMTKAERSEAPLALALPVTA